MPAATTYRSRRSDRSLQTREKIIGAVRELLAEGSFHQARVEEVARRAGVSRATLYQHFRSRLDLIDAVCEIFGANPALVELRTAVELPDIEEALARTVALASEFWASEDSVLAELYGVAAIDAAAQALVDRQRADRRGEMERLARRLAGAGRLRTGTGERRALQLLMVLTSYETFRELRLAGVAKRDVAKTLQGTAGALLLG